MTTHSFDVNEAVKYGAKSAVLLSTIRLWLTKKAHIREGYYWTNGSIEAFAALHPYLSCSCIRLTLKKLCKSGVLLSVNDNDGKSWYTLPAEFALTPLKENHE